MTGMHSDCSRVVACCWVQQSLGRSYCDRDNSGLKQVGFSFISANINGHKGTYSYRYFSSLFGNDSARPFHTGPFPQAYNPTYQNSLRSSQTRIWPSPEIPYIFINPKTKPPRDFNSYEQQKKKKKCVEKVECKNLNKTSLLNNKHLAEYHLTISLCHYAMKYPFTPMIHFNQQHFFYCLNIKILYKFLYFYISTRSVSFAIHCCKVPWGRFQNDILLHNAPQPQRLLAQMLCANSRSAFAASLVM